MVANYTYVGSTRDFKQRKSQHKHNFLNENCKEHNFKLYQAIKANGGWDAVEIKPIEEFECETSVQAHIREEYWRREYAATLNMRLSHQTEEEYEQYKRQYNAKYREAHPEYNREYNREYGAKYYEANREALKKYGREKIQCECGATICRGAKSSHLKSKRHTDRLAAQQQNIAIQ